MVTILKNTTKLVSDIPFPAVTICGSGVHMNNVEKKLIQDFKNWRAQEKRVETNWEGIYKDTEEFMQTRFQIEPSISSGEQPISILDILDELVAPDYAPTTEHILKLRDPTRTIHTRHFRVGKAQLRVMDVGGQRCERPKWNLAEDITAVIFVCALTEYNQVLREDIRQNRLKVQ